MEFQMISWRVDIQKGVTHNFSKIVFLAKQILEVNADTIAQTIFFFQSEIFLFSIWKSKICISRCRNGNVFVPPCKISEMWVTPFWMSSLQLSLMSSTNFDEPTKKKAKKNASQLHADKNEEAMQWEFLCFFFFFYAHAMLNWQT